MRQRVLCGALLAMAGALAACGGSSSETPPPLQPDPTGFRYASTPMPREDASDAGEAPKTIVDDSADDDPKPRAPAQSTWGTAPAPH
jgi:hypothetical protein